MEKQAKIIDGRILSTKIREKLKKEATKFEKKNKRPIGIAVVLVGEDPASQTYVKNKVKACEECGIKSFVIMRPAETSQDELDQIIRDLNESIEVDGILTQLPLPKHLDENHVLDLIDPKKDVDGFHIQNAGKLFVGQDSLVPCTPAGIVELIKSTGKRMEGKHAVIIGRSNIVGKPIAMLLLAQNCTVTICHSRTKNLARVTKRADILVAAIGRREFVTGGMIKRGAVVIDVGINRHEGKLYGDVNYDQASKIASHITPVPGGVGPMTITMLMSNTIKAAQATLETPQK
ncbi:MAG: bifunctional methylenetetrahydrofolate dehydrogenase/methenyltetrahydrofolate cyclohydrolase FolD [Firmicutes bacterium]|nr:bifunctional methylenetetrahydrofolate dehydrogenase/methenyltetrahydrofolate cyclohydrolase FolD [Bacillota bacterium]